MNKSHYHGTKGLPRTEARIQRDYSISKEGYEGLQYRGRNSTGGGTVPGAEQYRGRNSTGGGIVPAVG